MKYLVTAKGEKISVDDNDYKYLSQWKWRLHNGYPARRLRIKGSSSRPWLKLHHLIIEPIKGLVIDHRDGNPCNAVRSNFRVCRHKDNIRNNRGLRKFGYKGISWKSSHKKWVATITYNGKQYNLGYFDNPAHAALMYDFWATFFFGSFSRTNFGVVSHN